MIKRVFKNFIESYFIFKIFTWITFDYQQNQQFSLLFQGVFVIQDNKFSLIANIAEGTQYLEQIPIYLAMPSGMFYLEFMNSCVSLGIVRGALANLGINARVNASVEKLPIVRFNITIQASSSEDKHETQAAQR